MQHQCRSLLAYGVILFIIITLVNGLPANFSTYDQRQAGDFNLHISLKDVNIVALLGGKLGGAEDYDYNYDYGELTVKPIVFNKTTTEATTTSKDGDQDAITTEKVVAITPHPVLKPNQNKTESTQKANTTENFNATIPTHSGNSGYSSNPGIPVQILTTPIEVVNGNRDENNNTTLEPTLSTTKPTTLQETQAECMEGYRKDRRGTCRPKMKRPTQQTLLRKLIQLSHQMQAPANPRFKPRRQSI